MENEFLFYWFSWLLWGIIVFFMKENSLRSIFSWLILVVIFCSNIHLLIGGYHILLSFVCIIIVFALLYTYYLTSFYHLFVLFIVMIGYTAISFWEHRISLSLSIPTFLLVSMICSFLVVCMIKGLYSRLMIGILGVCVGQVLHGFILSSYHLKIIIGDTHFFMELYIVILLITTLHILHVIRTQWDHFINMLTAKKKMKQSDHLDNHC